MKKWILSLILTIILIFANTLSMTGLTPNGKVALLVFIWAICMWIIRPIPEYLSAIIAATILLLFKMDSVLAGFQSPVWWMVTFAAILGATITQTGLGRRLAYYILSKIGTSFLRIIYATTFVNNILAPFTPSNTARGAIMFGVVEGICDSMGFERGKRKGDHTLMLANMYINTTNTNMFLTAMGGNAIAVSLISKMTNHVITWTDWFVAAFVPGLPVIFLLPYIVYKMFPPDKDIKVDPGYAAKKLVEMGPMARAEKATLVIMLATLLLWATQIWHHIPAETITFVMVIALLMPKVGALEWKGVERSIPWPMLIWLGFAMGLAGVIASTGGFKWLINSLFLNSPTMAHIGYTGFLLILLIGIVFMHILFSGMNAMIMVIVPVAIQLAVMRHFDPYATGLIAALAATTAAFFLPFNSAPNLIFFSSGRYTVKDHLMGAIPLAVVIILSLLFALFVWWPAIGLI
ncbi:MAG: SLC13 family permease [Desulfitobacteriaceae bacterium]